MQDQHQPQDSSAQVNTPVEPVVPEALPYQAMEERVVDLEAQLAQAKEDFLRAKAETENVRRRAQDDIAKAHKFGVENFAEALVPVKDSLDAAVSDQTGSVETLKNGIELTLKQLNAAFERGKVVAIDPVGEKFDPARHQAISMVDAPGEPNRIVTVLQKGYLIYDRVLRPALVTVSKAPQQ